ncbi:OLC1v1006819C1 [Oldenlandia corymbosa var. corymbosa]|uniref:OLC1v1006819C1 n=1 Tax=Oldenlandia corymbosa var. corymbosa TaxID=529605 RepID=A0AAV1DKA6_OLDCO|nr:OLC1v1006819C1 [Oldenlandia corymbosa var. corymbosa]
MTQVNTGGVPFESRSSQPIYVPEYSEDKMEEDNEDDGQDHIRMGAHHRDLPMYNPGCPRPGPGGLPSPPSLISSPISGDWHSRSPSIPGAVQLPLGVSIGSRPRPSRASQASLSLIDPVGPHGGPISSGVYTRPPPPLIDPVGPRGGPSPLQYLHALLLSFILRALAEVLSSLEYLHVLLLLSHVLLPRLHQQYLIGGIDKMSSYSWDSTTLAYLYHQEGELPIQGASRQDDRRNSSEDYLQVIRQLGYHSPIDTVSTWRRFPESGQYSHPFLLPTTDTSSDSTPAQSSQDYDEVRLLPSRCTLGRYCLSRPRPMVLAQEHITRYDAKSTMAINNNIKVTGNIWSNGLGNEVIGVIL